MLLVNQDTLCKHWVHSFEEDTAESKIYRPENFKFPLARGRQGMELKPDGAFTGFQIGRNDVPSPEDGSWHLQNDKLLIKYPNHNDEQEFIIKEASDDKLVLTPQFSI
jgi:hypothetical protein